MKVLVPTDSKFWKDRSGGIHPVQPVHGEQFWQRYLEVFDKVIFTGRLFAKEPKEDLPNVINDDIDFVSLPGRMGLFNSFRGLCGLVRLINKNPNAAICLRMPAISSALVGLELLRRKRPFGVEVVGDPEQALNQCGIRWFFLRKFLTWAQRRLCGAAVATAYVTKKTLQKSYPPHPSAYTTFFSTISICDKNFHKAVAREKENITLVNVGSMGRVLYKAQDTLIRVFKDLLRTYPDIHLVLVGDGVARASLEKLVEQNNLSDYVTFSGHVKTRKEIEIILDSADIFLFPSRTEGMPKALIEAMARSLPAVGTRAGGIPELLDESVLCDVDDCETLEKLVALLIADPKKRTLEGHRNYFKAKEFHIDRIRKKRNDYYSKVREATLVYTARNVKGADACCK